MSSNAPQPYVALPDSGRQPASGAQESGTLDPSKQVEVSIYLRSKSLFALPAEAATPMTHAQYASGYGADQADASRGIFLTQLHFSKVPR